MLQHAPPLLSTHTQTLKNAPQVLAHPDSFDVAVTTYEMVSSNDFGRPIQSTIVRGACCLPAACGCVDTWPLWHSMAVTLPPTHAHACSLTLVCHTNTRHTRHTRHTPTDVALPGARRGPPRAQHGHADGQGPARGAARQRAAADGCVVRVHGVIVQGMHACTHTCAAFKAADTTSPS
jgi:hypothetical protein